MRKQSPHRPKLATTAARWLVKDLAIVYMSCDDVCIVYNRRSEQVIQVDKVLHELITGFAYKWSVLLAVYGYDAEGDEYMESELVVAKQEYLQATMAETLSEQHQRLAGEYKGESVVGLGWIALPEGRDPWGERGEEAIKLFKKLGAYGAPDNPDEGEKQ